MADEKRVNLQLSIRCVTSDGQPHHDYTFNWPNLSYSDLLMMQRMGTKLLDQMNEAAAGALGKATA